LTVVKFTAACGLLYYFAAYVIKLAEDLTICGSFTSEYKKAGGIYFPSGKGRKKNSFCSHSVLWRESQSK